MKRITRRNKGMSRREMLVGAASAAAAVALNSCGPTPVVWKPVPAGGCSAVTGSELQTIGELVATRTGDGPAVLSATITMRNHAEQIPGGTGTTMLRYIEGKDTPSGTVVWPCTAQPNAYMPGPTLRARVGDRVNISFFNHIDYKDFNNGTDFNIDREEEGVGFCDTVTAGLPPKEVYPAGDQPPDCFHASSTSNLHFHGTHVTPDGLGDNVFVQIRPNPDVKEDTVIDPGSKETVGSAFQKIFSTTPPPSAFKDLPSAWLKEQVNLVTEYNATAPYVYTDKNTKKTETRRGLPPAAALQVPDPNVAKFPDWGIGAYPYSFEITPEAKHTMGQAPGTHWYHAHKHGSTSVNLYNGLAGAFIIEGEYDDKLAKYFKNNYKYDLKANEKVLVVQEAAEKPKLSRGGPPPSPVVVVNGQVTPTIKMKAGEIQLWRFVNAGVSLAASGGKKGVVSSNCFAAVDANAKAIGAVAVKQTAQDGVQFSPSNYQKQPTLGANFMPGNRVDLLVKAPAVPKGQSGVVLEGTATFSFTLLNGATAFGKPILNLEVDLKSPPPEMQFPKDSEFPPLPAFLSDIGDGDLKPSHPGQPPKRLVRFGWEGPPEKGAPRAAAGGPPGPQFNVNGYQFDIKKPNNTPEKTSKDDYPVPADGLPEKQEVLLGAVEEWKIENWTAGISHPFHIHVNPFQVVEVYDPTQNPPLLVKLDKDRVWWDTIAIPPCVIQANGLPPQKADGTYDVGYVKFRSRFVDFAGQYVMHCHMLAHEDRGMMQEVIVREKAEDLGKAPEHHHH